MLDLVYLNNLAQLDEYLIFFFFKYHSTLLRNAEKELGIENMQNFDKQVNKQFWLFVCKNIKIYIFADPKMGFLQLATFLNAFGNLWQIFSIIKKLG